MFVPCHSQIVVVCLGQYARFQVFIQIVDTDIYEVLVVLVGVNDTEIGSEPFQIGIVAHTVGHGRFCQSLRIKVPFLLVHLFIVQQGGSHVFRNIGGGPFSTFDLFAVAESVFPLSQIIYLPAMPDDGLPVFLGLPLP